MKHIGGIDIIKVRRGSTKAASTIAGPNDATRVVWAISEFFFYYLCVLSLLMVTLKY